MVGKINLDSLTVEELGGIVSLYPWYGGAHAELCRRMAAMSDDVWRESQFGISALHIPDRRGLFEMVRKKNDCSDAEVQALVKRYFEEGLNEMSSDYRGVGDYFPISAYSEVRKSEDNIFGDFARGYDSVDTEEMDLSESERCDFYTETLAQVYLEQGYPEKAKEIYAQLILRYPEKSSYFAGLIDKTDKKI